MQLRIRMDDPGWFLNSPRLVVRCDGAVVYDGSFRGGFVASIDVAPGPHTIETAIELGGLARTKRYAIDMPSEDYREPTSGLEARLEYSRLWGNFGRTISLRRIDTTRR